MADRFPLIANSSANQIQELAASDQLNLTGSNLIFGDSSDGSSDDVLSFGASGDLKIFHQADQSRIVESGPSVLKIMGSDVRISNAGNTADYFQGNDGADVKLFHNGNLKLATTSGGVDVTGSLTVNGSALQTGPLVAYKAKEFIRSRYSFSGSSWHEIETSNRITHTPAASGNTIIMHTQVWGRNDSGNYGGFANVTDQGTGSNIAMIGETSGGGAVQKANILGGSTHNEMIRFTGSNNIWMGFHMWGYHVTANTNAHTFKLFGRMGNGTSYVGDNQMGQFMQIWEYSGNLMQ